MQVRILEGKRKGIPVEISLEISPEVDIISIVKRETKLMDIPIIKNPKSTLKCNAEETYLVKIWNGDLMPSHHFPLPTVLFKYMGYNGELNWIVLQLLLLKKIDILKAKQLEDYFWRIKRRIENNWNTSKWKNIRGLKCIEKID